MSVFWKCQFQNSGFAGGVSAVEGVAEGGTVVAADGRPVLGFG
jgi:hypothetical protein